MRLLWHVEDDIFVQASFEGKQLPPYAVLSHTWKEGQEVTYDDIIIGAGKDKSDFAKLRFCSEQAATDGLQYFWIDNCCLNRSSSSDLDMAINSRSLLFRRAAKCYVYLADVSVPGTADPQFFKSRWVEAFRRSEWFKEGWALQDLLVREDIDFFSKEGKRIGNKTTLLQEIHGVTQIPIKALKGHSLIWYSVEEKISWAASRRTARDEDIVYCLAGILGVFLPAAYGEGKVRAMQRLREGIQSTQELQKGKKVKNSYGKEAHPIHMIPFQRNPDFVDPGSLFDKLEERCSKPASRVAIVGSPGTGKSELVLEHCYRTIERLPNTCIFWVAANNPAEVEQGFHDIARRINTDGWQEPGADIFQLVYDWLCDSRDPWILVLDNLDDWSFPRDSKSIRRIIPYCRYGSTIITTRDKKEALRVVEMRDIVTVKQIHGEYARTLFNPFATHEGQLLPYDKTRFFLEENPFQLEDLLGDSEKDDNIEMAADRSKIWREMEAPNMHLLDKEFSKADESKYDIQHDDNRMSVQSIHSSKTLLPTFSELIVGGIATVELERVFLEDEELNDLYRLALKDTSMEPERLQRNLSRLLQFFAKDLRREAGDRLERRASRLVQSKAQYIAHRIVERFNDTPRGVPHQQTTSYEEEEGHEKTQLEVFEAQHQVNNEQVELDEAEEEATIDENFFYVLVILRTFVVRSSAFQIFRVRLTKFFLPKGSYQLDVDSMNDRSTEAPLSKTRHLLFSTTRILKSLLFMVGCLESRLQPGFIRLRWQCECGTPLYEDIQEYRIGGVSRLIERMEKSTGSKVTATSYNKDSPNQQYIPGPILWVREMARNMTKAFSRDGKCNDTLPQHNDPSIIATPESSDIESPPTRDLLLLACMHENQGGQLLRQDSIGTISNDRQLFCFIREQISRAPSKRWFSRLLKTVTGIHFTQFHLRLNDDVEPRLHKLCCRQDTCQCVPLTSNAEYDCTPAGPLDFGPPVLPSKMLHYFKHPDLISEKEMSILNQLPKRNCGKLQSTGQAPAEGWGLYYEENWNFGLMIVAFVGMTICASLVFGVWWTLARADIQGAWGVSSYMITACALVLGLVSIVGHTCGG